MIGRKNISEVTMESLTKNIISKIKLVLSNLETSFDYRRNEMQVRLLNDIRLSLSGDKPIFTFEASMSVDRRLAYLIGALVHAQSIDKKVVISTSNERHISELVEKLKMLQVAFDGSFKFERMTYIDSFTEADLYLITHEDFTKGVIFPDSSAIPKPSEAIYVFDEAHRLDELVSLYSKSEFSISEAYDLLDAVDVDTTKIQELLSQVQDWISERHFELFVNSSTCAFRYGIISQELFSALDQLQFLIGNLTISGQDVEELSDLVSCISGFLYYCEGEIPLAKWIRFDGDDRYTLSAQPISIEKAMHRAVWSNHSGVLLTSSVLKMADNLSPTGTSFIRFLNSVGLSYSRSHVGTYESLDEQYGQRTIVVPKLPFGVTSNEYSTWLKYNIYEYFKDAKGSLAVFTSRAIMESVRSHIESTCTENGVLIQCEGDRSVEEVLEYHYKAIKRGYKSIIFGLNGFPEQLGVLNNIDNLLLIRLPFCLPDEPQVKARAEYEQSLGHLPFYSMSLPQVSLELNQALLNTIGANDELSRCVIFDRRIISKSYSDALLKSLPPIQMQIE